MTTIPKIIWQTYKDPFDHLSQYIKDAANTWKKINLNYEYKYLDDKDAREFVLKEFGNEWIKIFDSYPLNVMRADLLRYMVLYVYGGVYADIDTLCQAKIDSWINKEKDMVVCVDDDLHNYAQFAIASAPKHPIIKNVLRLIKKESKNMNIHKDNFVENTTGPYIWTKAVKSGILSGASIYCYEGKDANLFHDKAIKHLGWSTWAPANDYSSWQKEIISKRGSIGE